MSPGTGASGASLLSAAITATHLIECLRPCLRTESLLGPIDILCPYVEIALDTAANYIHDTSPLRLQARHAPREYVSLCWFDTYSLIKGDQVSIVLLGIYREVISWLFIQETITAQRRRSNVLFCSSPSIFGQCYYGCVTVLEEVRQDSPDVPSIITNEARHFARHYTQRCKSFQPTWECIL